MKKFLFLSLFFLLSSFLLFPIASFTQIPNGVSIERKPYILLNVEKRKDTVKCIFGIIDTTQRFGVFVWTKGYKIYMRDSPKFKYYTISAISGGKEVLSPVDGYLIIKEFWNEEFYTTNF